MRPKPRCFGGGVVVLGTALTVGLGSSLAAGASPVTSKGTAHGTYALETDFTSHSSHSGAEIGQLRYKGGVAGIAIVYGTTLTHSNGSEVGSGTEYCAECTIAGKRGGFIAAYTYGRTTGTEAFIRGFGKLAGLKGGGTFTTNTYNYRYTLP